MGAAFQDSKKSVLTTNLMFKSAVLLGGELSYDDTYITSSSNFRYVCQVFM